MASVYDHIYDVVVVGGGVSGSCAAVAAAREGASVLLAEAAGYPGGTLTSCGVGPMMTFFAGEKQVIFGLMQEVVDRLVAGGYSIGHIHDTTRYVSYITPFQPEGMKLVLDEMLCEAGVVPLYHTVLAGVQTGGGEVQAVQLCNKDGLNWVKAKSFIDATGDGDLMAWAGAEHVKGRPEDGAAQPMTLKMKYCGVDTAALKAYIRAHLEDFPRLQSNLDLLNGDEPLALAGFDSVFRAAKAAGEVHIPREDILMFETDRPGEFILNTTRLLNLDATDAASLTRAEIEGRRQCAELDGFLRRYVPGFENALLQFTGPSVGIRGSRQLVGRYTLTAQDVVNAVPFASVICHSGYPIDIHSPDGEGTTTHYIEAGKGYYSIPYEIMLPKALSNLLVTGRCASASFEAQASIRLTPSAGGMGQAAGTAAAQAAKNGTTVADIDIPALQQSLAAQGVFLDI